MKTKAIFILGLMILMGQSHAKLINAEKQSNLTPQQSLKLLMQGNKRFIKEKQRMRNAIEIRKTTARKGQFPHSIVFNCIDSRSNPEIIFDQGLGSIFTSSIAGNVVDVDVIAGMEFAAVFAGSKLILVMGHTKCGAIKAACEKIGTPNIKKLTAKIMPAVNKLPRKDCNQYDYIDAIAKQNVMIQMDAILKQSPALKKLVKENKIAIIGAMHDLKSGTVTYFDRTGKIIVND